MHCLLGIASQITAWTMANGTVCDQQETRTDYELQTFPIKFEPRSVFCILLFAVTLILLAVTVPLPVTLSQLHKLKCHVTAAHALTT
jgi:4-hydroxybenzoate polyprenyltransferase